MAEIKNIIFDLSGVLINVDYMAPIREFRKLGIDVDEHWFSKAGQDKLFDYFETGRISASDFRNEIRKLSGRPLDNKQIDDAWNSVLLDFPRERMDMLFELKKKYRLFLLSNTNAIHIPELNQQEF